MKEQSPSRIARIHTLVNHPQIDALALQLVGHLAEMQCRALQPIQSAHHQRIVLPNVSRQAFSQSRLLEVPVRFSSNILSLPFSFLIGTSRFWPTELTRA